tara:strand:- start:1178 stop:2155 length:978 start_codon:yes stop_codon:yes gene_type:complete
MDKKWILNTVDFLKKIENQNYTWTLSEKNNKLSNNAKLSAVALFAKCAYIFKNYHNFDENKIFEIIKKYRQTNGYFIDNTKDQENIIAETRQAISGIINLNKKKLIDCHVDLKVYYPDKNNLYFMNDKLWNRPWSAGARMSHYMFFLQLENNKKKIKNLLKKLKKYERKDGWYNEKAEEHIRINGIMKVFTGLDIIQFNYKSIENLLKKIIDNLLKTSPNDKKGSKGCNIYDFVYVLCKYKLINYREKECKDKLMKIYHLILNLQHDDGGFSSKSNNKTSPKMYGKKIYSGRNQGGIHGTTLFCMALCMIDKACDLNLNLNIPIS